MPALDQSTIHSLSTIPNLASLEKGRQLMNNLMENQRSSKIIMIPEFGVIDNDGLAALTRANVFMDTVEAVADLIKWLRDNDLHGEETSKVRSQLAKFIPKRNPFKHSFRSFYDHGKTLTLTQIARFRRDEWLGEAHIDAILHTIEAKHGGGDSANFFILPQPFVQGFIEAVHNPSIPTENWNPHRLKQALDLQDVVDANPECQARALTVVNIGNHWAVLVFDFKQKRILFGHSMDKGILDKKEHAYVFAGARSLLESCQSRVLTLREKDTTTESDSSIHRIRVDEWVNGPLRFFVPQQQDSSSCGFAALSAIENSIHPPSELWSNERKVFFRVKYLVYATSTFREVRQLYDSRLDYVIVVYALL